MQKQRLGRQRRELSAAARQEPEAEAEAAVGGSSSSSSSSGQLLEQQIMELTVEADGRSGEQKPGTPTTPRSKHSATEQRRRCKINERFQILRDLIPHIDQKRDRATFLLEVIEYVKFLQEKVQKNEACTEWNQENAKLMPWSNNRVPVDGMPDTAHATRNGPVPGQMLSGKFVDNSIPAAPAMLHNTQNAAESADINTDSLASQSQSQWQQFSYPADCTISNDTSDEHEELAIDEGTITVSSVYSQNLFTALTHAMESLGVDLSQASVTVQVNLGKRAICRRPNTVSCSKGQDDSLPANQTMEDSGQTRSCDDSEQASKRHKINRS